MNTINYIIYIYIQYRGIYNIYIIDVYYRIHNTVDMYNI